MTAPAPAWLDRQAYPFAHHHVDLAAGRMHYLDEGAPAAEALLFVHGTPTWSFEWRHLVRALAPRYRCVAPDLLGFGLSERPAGFAYTPEAHAAVLEDFVARLGLRDFTLVVHDYGGPIGLPLALAGRARRVVVLNSWMWPFDGDAEMQKRARLVSGRLGRFLYRWLNASLRLLMPGAYGDRRKLTPAIHRQYLEPFRDRAARVQVLWPLARALLRSREHYAKLEAGAAKLRALPTLIVWGLRDTAFRPHQLERWQALVPDAHIVQLAEAGHWPHEEAPAAVVEAVEGFLGKRSEVLDAAAGTY